MTASFDLTSASAFSKEDQISLEQRILREQADSLLSTSRSFSLTGFFLALCFGTIFYYQLRLPVILAWMVAIGSVQLLRIASSMRYLQTAEALRQPEQTAQRYCYAMGVTSIAWGLAPWLFFPTNNTSLTSLLMIMLLGMSSGGIASVAPYRKAVFFLAVPMLVGLCTALLWQGDGLNGFLALCTLAYLSVSLRFGLQQHRLLADAWRARYEKETFAQRLADQIRIVELASLEKTRFFASASHDLRQPLHSLGLFGSAILARLKTTPDELLAQNLMQCVDALEASFSSMLDVSKLDAGVVTPKASAVSLGVVFRRLQASYGRQAHAQGLALRFKPGNKWVMTDAALLERLLGNLIHNAIKFSQQGGVAVVARTRGQQISVEVWDTGTGMHQRELSRIFDEFYQVDNRERDRSMGLGMGLAIVRRLSQLMGTPVIVQSRMARGTVFKVLVSATVSQHKLAAPSIPESSSSAMRVLAGMAVLVVDDEENVRTSTAAALQLYGLDVKLADGVEQATQIAQNLGPTLGALITDFRLRSQEDGITLVHQIRSILGRQVPALLITGDTAPERVHQAQVSGLRVLYKPVKIHDLVEELRLQMQ